MALYESGHIFLAYIFLTLITKAYSDDFKLAAEVATATLASEETYNAFFSMFERCSTSRMPHMQYLIDDVQRFVNYPSKTTVGLATKFTANRKFFANMITTTAFKEMLSKDADEIWNNLIKKLQYCDQIVMDQEILKEYYDREVDQSKL